MNKLWTPDNLQFVHILFIRSSYLLGIILFTICSQIFPPFTICSHFAAAQQRKPVHNLFIFAAAAAAAADSRRRRAKKFVNKLWTNYEAIMKPNRSWLARPIKKIEPRSTKNMNKPLTKYEQTINKLKLALGAKLWTNR